MSSPAGPPIRPVSPAADADADARLAEQAPGALLELLRGFQAADPASLSALDPRHVLDGLVTVLLRLVVLLHAEDRGLMPARDSVTELALRLREQLQLAPAGSRHGAWAALQAHFRRVHATHGGRLFDPDRHPFLAERSIADDALGRVLAALLILDGQRVAYRALDIEHLGAVYESMLGYTLTRLCGPGVAVRPHHLLVDLADLLSQKPGERAGHLRAATGCELSGAALSALETADTLDDVLLALARKQSPRTPALVPAGALYLQPGEERRRSGSHYTPRSLTGPIVRTALRPLLEALGERPTPAQLLDLKLCDPAMGSGAFLLEAARQLGEQLRRAWALHGLSPAIADDDDLEHHARRLVARSCVHGVDRDPLAVELARHSLWLITAARDQPFTFLDHALKHGDSLVGLDRRQIAAFRWDHADRHDPHIEPLHPQHARLLGDAALHTYFAEDSDKKRNQRREALLAALERPDALERLERLGAELRGGDRPVHPFHWPLEFPAVLDRDNPGFDCFVGNPPFLGGTRLSTVSGVAYFEWLLLRNPGTHHLCDLVAHFLRIAFALLRRSGTLGFVATNTVAQGDTRIGGLAWISGRGGVLYAAERRRRWPGSAAVVVSVVHIHKGPTTTPRTLDGRPVAHISSYLFDSAHDDTPRRLPGAAQCFSLGSKIYGQGFLFADDDPGATPLATMAALLTRAPHIRARIFPYIGGHEVNQSPTQVPARHAIYLSDLGTEAELQPWPELAAIVRARVKPERDRLGANPNNTPLKRRWWAYQAHRPALYAAIRPLRRVLVLSRMSRSFAFTFLPPNYIYSEQLVVFTFESFGAFTTLQSRVHELWARSFSSSMRDDLRYTPSDCFETFPFPRDWHDDAALESTGARYYQHRADLMRRDSQGLTATYNRFHDPDERSPDILELRERHDAMDRAVLAAYGWHDLAARVTCEFRLDYEDDGAPARKRPWRHRWPQELHDEVLARLLDLNLRRAAEEPLPGGAD